MEIESSSSELMKYFKVTTKESIEEFIYSDNSDSNLTSCAANEWITQKSL